MNNLLNTINETLLMGPGPSSVAPTVYSSIGKSTIGHLDPKFIEIMDAIKLQLQTLMGTKNELTIPISVTRSLLIFFALMKLTPPKNFAAFVFFGFS